MMSGIIKSTQRAESQKTYLEYIDWIKANGHFFKEFKPPLKYEYRTEKIGEFKKQEEKKEDDDQDYLKLIYSYANTTRSMLQ